MRGFKPVFAVLVVIVFLSCGADEKESTVPESVLVPSDFAGMCHSGSSNDLDREYAMLNEMGIVWVHRDFSWSSIEPDEGNFVFNQFDGYVERANAEGKKIIGMLLYDVKWVHDLMDHENQRRIWNDEIPYFTKYAAETVKRYNGKNGHGKVDAWFIWNEPDLTPRFWTGTKDEFFALTKATAEAIRVLDAEQGTVTTLVGGVFTAIASDEWIKGLFESGAMDKVDGVAYHPYSPSPSGSLAFYKAFREKTARYGFTDKIWINEMGYPTYSEKGALPAGRYGTDQYEGDMPEIAARTFVLLAAAGAKNLTWYHLFDGANRDNSDSEDWFGLVWQKSADEWIKKGGYWGYALCAKHIPGKTYKEKNFFNGTVPANIRSAYFEGHDSEDGNTFIVWNDSPLRSADVTITLSGVNHKLWDVESGESSNIDKTSTHTLYPANTGQKNLIFLTWQE